MSDWINFNGSLISADTPVLTAGSRAFRYGDGLFETMLVEEGRIALKDLHFDRLFNGIGILKIRLDALIDRTYLEEQVLKVLTKNLVGGYGRVRLAVFRGEGGLYETDGQDTGYLIQAWPLPQKPALNDNGLRIGVYEQGMKSCDGLANLKTNNYLVYAMAAIHAKANGWNDCLILNSHGRVCDATIANLFWIKDGKVYTPPLSEGCVAGVMRRHLLNVLRHTGFTVDEQPATLKMLEDADEIFLTNAISGIRWVEEFGGRRFTNTGTTDIFRKTF